MFQEVELSKDGEEMATFFAMVPETAEQFKTAESKATFIANFFTDFRSVLGKDHVIKTFEKCDFGPIRKWVQETSEARKARSKEEKAVEKEAKDAVTRRLGFALVNGDHIERVGNTTIEPPSLFRGRGKHPKAGVLKQRVMPEDITINVSRGERSWCRGFVFKVQSELFVLSQTHLCPSALSPDTTGGL